MKLIVCTKCNDIVRLITDKERFCSCGLSSGQYTNNIDAWYKGDNCIPLGINNSSLIYAIGISEYRLNKGTEFISFVIPKNCKTFKKN